MDKPAYDLSTAKQLVRSRSFFTTSRVRKFLKEHYGDVSETLVEVFDCIKPEHFHKSVILEHRQGTQADIYRPFYDETQWYVKFFIDDGAPTVDIWSCNWDGCIH